MKIGIDSGGTLIKIAYMEKDKIEVKKLSVFEIDQIASWINSFNSAEICVTGGRANQLKSYLNNTVSVILEFDATINGAIYLLHNEAFELETYILTNVGTGTSIHYVQKDRHERIGGTGVGGGTLMGLSQLLTGLSSYNEIVSKVPLGNREQIDLKVSDIYRGSPPPISGNLTASNFGKLFVNEESDGLSKEDLLSSVIGLIGETVATVSVLAAGQYKASSIVYIGSTFINNEPLKKVIYDYTNLRGAKPIFLNNGEYCGAIGALLSTL
ncbi:type II pantothenate kinase [Paenibacillus macquariensis subsp. defensor]|nr:type II pantothenate kinase [Paenibacillus macquariensis subsp. defensor]